MKKTLLPLAAGILSLTAFLSTPLPVRAADHADGPNAANDQGTDLADIYAFLDPLDNTKTVLIFTWRGFITPGEGVNLTVFDPGMRFRYAIENTGDAKADKFIDVSFGPKLATEGQKVFIEFSGIKGKVEAIGTLPNLTAVAPPPVITTVSVSGQNVEVFAGLVDDPFFFDIPAFSRFSIAQKKQVSTGVAQDPAPTSYFSRSRDTFAGYNLLTVAMRMPTSLLTKVGGPSTIGVAVLAQRHNTEVASTKGIRKGAGVFRTVDREGIPGINAVLLPLSLRNAYNASDPSLDVKPGNPFATAILETLTSLGTDAAHQAILADVAVTHGDYLRLETDPAKKPNAGLGGGETAGSGFPNGRRLKDDVIDTILFLASNEALKTGDSVNENDVKFRDVFPYIAAPQQPRNPELPEDNTRN